MPNIRVTCLLCEDRVEVPADEVVLHLGGPGPTAARRYGFNCPGCAVYVVRRASEAIVEALLHTDEVEVATGTVPPWETGQRPGIVLVDAGRTPRLAASDAAPITEADVLLLRRALDDDAILAAWLTD